MKRRRISVKRWYSKWRWLPEFGEWYVMLRTGGEPRKLVLYTYVIWFCWELRVWKNSSLKGPNERAHN